MRPLGASTLPPPPSAPCRALGRSSAHALVVVTGAYTSKNSAAERCGETLPGTRHTRRVADAAATSDRHGQSDGDGQIPGRRAVEGHGVLGAAAGRRRVLAAGNAISAPTLPHGNPQDGLAGLNAEASPAAM